MNDKKTKQNVSISFEKTKEKDSRIKSKLLTYIPEKLEILSQQTGLEKQQLRTLYRAFKGVCPNGAIDESTFKNIYCQLFPLGDGNAYAKYIFKTFDEKENGCITFSNLVTNLAYVLNGGLKEKLQWIFRLYDIDGDGKISKQEMSTIIQAIHNLLSPNEELSKEHTNLKLDLNSDGIITLDEFISYCFNVSNFFLCFTKIIFLSISLYT
ncbi:Kv channel-interacting protein, putative [Pediculus humanus corporis]|uniref:Kv channel-interacting protein, putative n=1 Tax=Pediculus humanus subsp. corporis TaxID=121224 RepID=E0V9L5_PEDHC|nr:Kv channel-interacting protein, putative [Pediculus humanus corporis]EEB10071.1 Kv channel-interacting protein, putative [Pediculus humanus corporis]